MSFVNLDTMFYAQKKLIDNIKKDKPDFFKDLSLGMVIEYSCYASFLTT